MNFSYFDQFPDIEIDLTQYLINIASTGTPYTLSNRQPVKTKIKNLFINYEFDTNFKNNINLITRYEIIEGELPEVTSFKNYQTVDFWWLVLVFNDIQNPLRDWPLTQSQLNSLADSLYASDNKYTRNTYYELLFERNEVKRQILLPRPEVLTDIIWMYQQKILENI